MQTKYVILRCEDTGRGENVASLLEGAKLPQLQQMAQAGSAGLVIPPARLSSIDRFQLHRGLLGLSLRDPEATPSACYAASLGLDLKEGQTAWCCEFVTHRDGRIVDATAGSITTNESQMLLQALESQLGSEQLCWKLGRESHHLLLVSDPTLQNDGQAPIRSPERVLEESWRRCLPKGILGNSLRRLIEQASSVLEAHTINRVRIDLGENPANMVWLWGPGHRSPARSFSERTGLSGLLMSNDFPMRGMARILGLDWKEALESLEEASFRSLTQKLNRAVEKYDFVYLHLVIRTSQAIERLCAMERMDQWLVKPLVSQLPERTSWRILIVIDDRPDDGAAVVAMGSDLGKSPIVHLNRKDFAESAFRFSHTSDLFSWFVPKTDGLNERP